MPRLATKTYGRSTEKNTYASKAFDDVVKDGPKASTGRSTAMAASTIQRWGAASFTSTRGTTSQEVMTETRKRPADTEEPRCYDFGDPFSFDSDDEGPTAPKKGMGFKAGGKDCKRNTATSSKATYSKASAGKTEVNSNRSVATYSRKPAPANNTTVTAVKPITIKTIGSTRAVVDSSAKLKASAETAQPKKQMSIDSFTTRIVIPSSATDISNSRVPTPPVTKTDLAYNNGTPLGSTRKFFTSSAQNSAGSTDDHTYSSPDSPHTGEDHNYSQNRGLRRQEAADEDEAWESDYGSDWDIDSGDPEIIFNSPKKKAELALEREKKKLSAVRNIAAQLQDVDNPVSDSDNDTGSVCSSVSSSTQLERRKGDFERKYCRKTSGKLSTGDSDNTALSASQPKEFGSGQSTASSGSDSAELRSSLSYGKQSILAGAEQKKLGKPLVRRLLTSPKKVS